MKKVITHIDCPKEWESENDYDSHRELLYLILSNDKESHPVAEFGSGFGSTFLLRDYCKEHNRGFESYETDEIWANTTGSTLIESFKNKKLPMGYILFIDGKPGEERKNLIYNNKDKHIIIVHDTELGAEYVYGMSEILSTFKYRIDYQPKGKPHTTAVSNYINITEWF